MQLMFPGYSNSTFAPDDQDQQIGSMLLESLLNFVKNKNPAAPGSKIPVWLPYGAANCYLDISEKPTMKFNFYKKDCAFWIDKNVL